MIVRWGPVLHDSPLGTLHLDRHLDDAQLTLIVAALQRAGWSPKVVTEVELTEGDAVVTAFTDPPELDGDELVRHVKRIRLGGPQPRLDGRETGQR